LPVFPGDVLTQHNNAARTGAILDETQLNTTNVTVSKFGKLWSLYTDGQVVAQPLYVSSLQVDTTANTTGRLFLCGRAKPSCENTNAVQQVSAFDPIVHNGQTHYVNIHGAPGRRIDKANRHRVGARQLPVETMVHLQQPAAGDSRLVMGACSRKPVGALSIYRCRRRFDRKFTITYPA
jgi:hypothetical protein